MNSRIHGLLGLAASLALASGAAFAQDTTPATTAEQPVAAAPADTVPAAPLKLSNKWRLEVSEGANNDGTLLFRVTPDKGTPQDVMVTLKKGRGEDGCRARHPRTRSRPSSTARSTRSKSTMAKTCWSRSARDPTSRSSSSSPPSRARASTSRRNDAGLHAGTAGFRVHPAARQVAARRWRRDQPDVMLSTVTK